LLNNKGDNLSHVNYISDIITQEEIAKWKPQDRILICSQTGTGKSQFIKNILKDYAIRNDKQMLLLTNRNILKRQNIEELGSKEDGISVKNYQSIESSILYGNQLKPIFDPFYYVVFDECHYLLNDSSFNRNTDLLLNNLIHPDENKIYLFLTATPEALLNYHSVFEYKYDIPKNYKHISNIYYYSKMETVENILRSIPHTEQAIYFGNAMDAYDFHNMFKDTSKFICSENNTVFAKKSSRTTIEKIETESRFDDHFLFATKVLDNGVNLKSPQLKHIIIDMLDPTDIIQCLGRKRIDFNNPNDTITVYIKNRNRGELLSSIKRIRSNLNYVRELNDLGINEFLNKYSRKQFDTIIHNDGTVNQAKLYYYIYFLNVLEQMFNYNSQSYSSLIDNTLKDRTHIAESYFESIKLEDVLEKYTNRKLYKNGELELFRNDFFNNLFSPQKTRDVRNRGLHSINSILEEDELHYYITSRQEKERSKYHNVTYWTINKV
jgi:hypothetical protein